MRLALLALLLGPACLSQTRLNHQQSAEAARTFAGADEAASFRCRITPIPPRLNFGFRYQAGFSLTAPLDQFAGVGRRIVVLLRVAPQDGSAPPSYFLQNYFLPEVPRSGNSLELGGGLLFGEGRYRIDALALDERDRFCRKGWSIEVARNRGQRQVPAILAPGHVAELSLRGAERIDPAASGRKPLRLTVLVNAAARSTRAAQLRASDIMLLISTLSALIEQVPATAIRLAVFNLDQHKVLYSNDAFSLSAMSEAATAMSRLEIGGVDVSVLKDRKGHLALLTSLIARESSRPDPSDAVVFLGPLTRHFDRPAVSRAAASPTRYYYFHFLPPMRGGQLPDSIDHAVRLLGGRRFEIYTPAQFAKAIDHLSPPAR